VRKGVKGWDGFVMIWMSKKGVRKRVKAIPKLSDACHTT